MKLPVKIFKMKVRANNLNVAEVKKKIVVRVNKRSPLVVAKSVA